MSEVTDYLKTLTKTQQAEYKHIRSLVKELAPKATEVISYGIPTFKVGKQPLIYFGAFKDHMSLFPASDDMVKAIPEVAKFRTSKGTLQFTASKPIPEPVIKAIIGHRLKNI